MNYRPQFAYPMVAGEEDFVYFFNLNNLPALQLVTVAPGQAIDNIVLRVDTDAPFLVRAVKVMTPAFPFSISLKDGTGKLLSDDALPEYLIYQPSNTPDWGIAAPAIIGFPGVVFEPEIPLDPGGLLLLRILNATAAPLQLAAVELALHGVKQWKGAD